MIKKNRIKKIFLLTTFFALLTTQNYDICYAGPAFSASGVAGFSGGTNSSKPAGEITKKGENGWETTCKWWINVNVWSNVYIDMYDMYGKKISNPFNVQQSLASQGINDFVAGTYVGLNIYEEKGYIISSRYEISNTRTMYNCSNCTNYSSGKSPGKKPNLGQWASPLTYNGDSEDTNEPSQIAITGYVCTNWSNFDTHDINKCERINNKYTQPRAATAAEKAWCKQAATPKSGITLEPSYSVSYRDSNDIDNKQSSDKYNTAETVTSTRSCSERIVSELSSSQTCKFYYNREKTCINAKTGQVGYIKSNQKCDTETEYTLESNNNYWKYFIPLNTKSSEGFSFTMHSSGSKQNAMICQNIIDNYDNYKQLIADENGNPFTNSDTKRSAKAKVANGCYYQTTVTIPVEQKFYNEVDGTKFNGFNFYYKPIDVNNPFPNGLTNTSLWYEWNQNKNQKPDISESYDEITYIAQISDVKAIRNYTKNNPYTNWYNMRINGTSSFIENGGVITRYVDRDSYYPLGCGPSNENEYTKTGIKNVFYQKECSNK